MPAKLVALFSEVSEAAQRATCFCHRPTEHDNAARYTSVNTRNVTRYLSCDKEHDFHLYSRLKSSDLAFISLMAQGNPTSNKHKNGLCTNNILQSFHCY